MPHRSARTGKPVRSAADVAAGGVRVFLLSPARLDGVRGARVLRKGARLDLARRLGEPGGVPIGEVYAFVSSLYFRGKALYAERFARPPRGHPGAYVIVPGRGLLRPDERVTLDDLRAVANRPVDEDDPAYREPLLRDARRLAGALGPRGRAILLGSLATARYVRPLAEALGPRLHFPSVFVGRGDMSRGGMMLRASRSGAELAYEVATGECLRGPRPPRLGR